MVNPFYVEPGQNFGQGLQSLAGTVDQFGQRQKQEQAAQEQKAYEQAAKQAMINAFNSDNPADVRNAIIQFPEIADTMKQAFGFTNDQTEQIARQTYRQALSATDPQRKAAIMQQGIQAVQQFGGRPTNMMADLQMLQENPEAFDRSAKAGYAALASDQEYEAMFGGGMGGPSIGTYNPRDYTTESFAKFTQTNDPSVLERYASQRTVDIGGVPHTFDPARGGYYPARVSGEGQGEPVTAETVGEAEAERVTATETAKQDVKANSPAERRKVEAEISERRKELGNAQDVLSRIQNIENNPGFIESITGIRGKMPAIPGTEGFDAEIAFDQLRDTLTLGNLSKMSGVLSESDIQILRSAASGLEYGMSEEALNKRLQEIRSVFEDKTQAERERISELMGGQPNQDTGGMSDDDADALINSILEQ